MNKQAVVVRGSQNWRKFVAALLLAAVLTGLPLLAANVPGPVSDLFVQSAYACPLGGNCG